MLGHGLNISKHQPSGTAPLLLDAFPGAAAAYSLRELSKDWEGQAVVRVRRDSDNAEADFTMAEILDGDLLAWVYGASSLTVFNTLPADHGSGAVAAYSLRYVSEAYELANEPVIRVRRTSDDAEEDFTPIEINNGTLEDWVNYYSNILPADHNTGAYVGYSLRYVASAYEIANSPVVRVRRSIDNSEQDFTPSEIEDGTVEAFCGVNDGFITTMYNQTITTSQDLTQSTAASQPQIVSSGTLLMDNGKPAISGGILNNTNFNIANTQSFNFSVVGRKSGVNSTLYPLDGITDRIILGRDNFSGNKMGLWFNSVWYNGGPVNDTDQIIYFGLRSNSINSTRLYRNNTIIVTQNFKNSIWGGLKYNCGTGYQQELIYYTVDDLNLRDVIVKNQSDYYSISSSGTVNDGYITAWYDQKNTYNATQNTAGVQSQIINNGNFILQNNKPSIKFTTGKNIIVDASIVPALTSGSNAEILNYFIANIAQKTSFGNALPRLSVNFGSNTIMGLPQIFENASFNRIRFYLNNTTPTTAIDPSRLNTNLMYASRITINNSNPSSPNGSMSVNINSDTESSSGLISPALATDPFASTDSLLISAFTELYLQEWIIYDDYNLAERQDVWYNMIYNYQTKVRNGYVTKWYNQTPATFDIDQSTVTYQPLIVKSGVLVEVNSLPAIDFFANVAHLKSVATTYTNIETGDPFTILMVMRYPPVAPQVSLHKGLNSYKTSGWYIDRSTLILNVSGDADSVNVGYSPDTHLLLAFTSDGTDIYGYSNDSLESTVLNYEYDTNTNSLNIGRYHAILSDTNADYEGTVQEVCIYLQDKSSVLDTLQSNINSYYSIY